jgi:hypothetical protein
VVEVAELFVYREMKSLIWRRMISSEYSSGIIIGVMLSRRMAEIEVGFL